MKIAIHDQFFAILDDVSPNKQRLRFGRPNRAEALTARPSSAQTTKSFDTSLPTPSVVTKRNADDNEKEDARQQGPGD